MLFSKGDRVKILDRDIDAWVNCTVDGLDDEVSPRVLTAMSDEKQDWGEGRPTLYAVTRPDWGVLVLPLEESNDD